MKTLLRLLLKSQHQQNRSGPAQTEKGMTLIELLIGTVMAFLIITPMLGFVVDMLNTDRREQVKSNTEQDIQAAVDFIAQDLSQAIYIYDNNAINLGSAATPATPAVPAIRTQLPSAPANTTGTPILVFWKRQQIPKSLPINAIKPKECDANPGQCNDTYVLSLVAYYQIKDNTTNSTWCQPSGGDCPTRIARYEIRDGIKDPLTQQPYADGDIKDGQKRDPAFDSRFVLSDPKTNVTLPAGLTLATSGATKPEVLVNYIDYSPLPANQAPTGQQCQTDLGVTPPTGPGAPPFNAADLLITDGSTHSFYACVDTQKNLARVTIRGNSLRRFQAKDADYNANKSAFFPTATVQVQGLGARGK